MILQPDTDPLGVSLATKIETAETMGVSERTITRWVANNHIPFHKFGNGSIRFNIAEILQHTRGEAKWDQ